MLAYLRRQDLFVVETAGGALRYHHIFHNFLRQQAAPDQRRAWNRLAANYFQADKDPETAMVHLLEAGAWKELADLLDIYAANLLSTGRLDTLASYLETLPPETLHRHPMLVFTPGELARLHSRFDEAQGWYKIRKRSGAPAASRTALPVPCADRRASTSIRSTPARQNNCPKKPSA